MQWGPKCRAPGDDALCNKQMLADRTLEQQQQASQTGTHSLRGPNPRDAPIIRSTLSTPCHHLLFTVGTLAHTDGLTQQNTQTSSADQDTQQQRLLS